MDAKLRNMTAVYVFHEDQLLMLYRIGSRVVPPSWCGIGGHFEPDELNDAKAAALRELKEEVGLTQGDLENFALRYITMRNKNQEIRLNYYFFADLRDDVQIKMECNEGQLAWIHKDHLPYDEMPYTAKYMLEHYMQHGVNTKALYAGITHKGGVLFHELQEF